MESIALFRFLNAYIKYPEAHMTLGYFDWLASTEAINILAGFMTPVIAAVVAWIAYMQMVTSKESLKINLFDRRWDFYKKIDTSLLRIIRDGRSDFEDINLIQSAQQESIFLFGQDVSDYLATLCRKTIELYSATKLMESLDEDKRITAVKNAHENLIWISEQPSKWRDILVKYIAFKKL